VICYLFVTRWQGVTYLKSKNPQEKQIGIIACILLAVSTVLVIYLAYVWTLQIVQSQINAVNTDFTNF